MLGSKLDLTRLTLSLRLVKGRYFLTVIFAEDVSVFLEWANPTLSFSSMSGMNRKVS